MTSQKISKPDQRPRRKKLKLFLAIAVSALFVLSAFIAGSFVYFNLHNSGRESIKIEKNISIDEFDRIHIQTVSTRIVVVQAEENDLKVSLEGHFRKSLGEPLIVETTGRQLSAKIDEAQEGILRAELTISVPKTLSKPLVIESVSGRIDVSAARAVAKYIKVSSVSGATSFRSLDP